MTTFLVSRTWIEMFAIAATPEPQAQLQATAAGSEFTPIQVRIYYNLRNPVEGFQFILPSDAYPYVCPQLHLPTPSADIAFSVCRMPIPRPHRQILRDVGSHVSIISGKSAHGNSSLLFRRHLRIQQALRMWMLTSLEEHLR